MPVKIKITGVKQNTDEYDAANELKEMFEEAFKSFTKADGEILIASNVTLIGQEVKDVDLVVIGKLKNFQIQFKTKSYNSSRIVDHDLKPRNVFINDFCFVIETKKHTVENIVLHGTQLLVRYGKKYHDATDQSEKQKYALRRYFEERVGGAPYICNFIWLKNVSPNEIRTLIGDSSWDTAHNYLPNKFQLKWLVQLACLQRIPYQPSEQESCRFNSTTKDDDNSYIAAIDSALNFFTEIKKGMGELTRKKLEQITKKLLKDQKYAQAIGEKLVILSGRAGTGKTIRLLNIACDLALQQGQRCLILTYNHALVSDIKRTLALTDIPDRDEYTVNISTLHKFFYDIFNGFGIGFQDNKMIKDEGQSYTDWYNNNLNELYGYFKEHIIEQSDLDKLMKRNHTQLAWDYILIDEGQDWDEIEKDLIFFIFGRKNVIVTDGVDQLVRSQDKCIWQRGMSKNDFHMTYGKKGLRQKKELVSFIAKFASEIELGNWDIEPSDDLHGGRIIIKIGDYTKELHDNLSNDCKAKGNSAYDMLFLVPPNLVKHNQMRSFSLVDAFEKDDIRIWDGTNRDLRTSYSINIEEHRLLQYDSCRGLEGWVVTCLHLDDFIKYKFNTFEESKKREEALLDFNHKRAKFVNHWTLIPLTRAIDTLVITIRDRDSDTGKILRKLYEENPDSIEWIE